MNQIQKKQQKKLNQEKRNLKKQKEDLKSISISQKKMKKANISKEKESPKRSFPFLVGRRKRAFRKQSLI